MLPTLDIKSVLYTEQSQYYLFRYMSANTTVSELLMQAANERAASIEFTYCGGKDATDWEDCRISFPELYKEEAFEKLKELLDSYCNLIKMSY